MCDFEKFESGNTTSIATGEFGFCRNCGEPGPVVMPAGDRLQSRLRAAFDQVARRDGLDVEEFAEQLMEIGIQEIKQFGLLEHPAPERLLIGLVMMEQAMVLIERQLARRLDRPVDVLRLATEGAENDLLD